MRKLFTLAFAIALTNGFAGELTHFDGAVKAKRGGLVHTRQLLGLGDPGAADLMGQLKGICRAYDSNLTDVAKLNFYIAEDTPELKSAIEDALKSNWADGKRPAVTTIPTRLPGDTKLALDAVIATDSNESTVERFERDAALMPANRDIVYVSGRAAKGELAEATSGTMKELFEVLAHLGSEPKDVVQVKAFIKPMSDWEVVEAAIEKSFGELGAPPVVYVEWISSLATEIELIAAAPDRQDTTETISYVTPPGDKASPVYSRVARVHADEVIYVSALAGGQADSPEAEVNDLYAALERVSKQAGSDLRHFAKATYYVSDDAVSAALNKLRPNFYDPARPPAASKVQVPSVGVAKRGLLIDMVAAPAPAAAGPKEAWIQLFNGENLDGWTPKIRHQEFGEDPKKTFRVENGAIKVGYENYDEFGETFGHIFYKTPFSHYRLRVEYRFVGDQLKGGPDWATRNSGIMLHCQDPATMTKDQDFPVSLEAQLLGGDGANERQTANLCTPGCHVVMKDELIKQHCIKSTSKTYHGEQWVTVEVEARGGEIIKHIMEGETVIEYSLPVLDDTSPSAKPLIEAAGGKIEIEGGWISLQSESHPVEFRKVELLKLEE